MPKVKAPGQLSATFGADEMELHDLVKKINDQMGVPVSVVIKKALAATLADDADALKQLQNYRSFSEARLLARASEA